MIRTAARVALLSIVGATAVFGQPSRREVLYIESGRPVAEAIKKLTDRYPVVITYEDPRYEYAGDLMDVTDQVRNPLNPNPKSDLQILVPRRTFREFSYEVASNTDQPADLTDALATLVEANDLYPFGGRFEIRRSGDVFHIVPKQVRDRDGLWIPQVPVLDTRISIPSQNLSGYDALRTILTEIEEASGESLAFAGEQFMGTFSNSIVELEADREPARDVLLRTLQAMSDRFTWRLLYGPSIEHYVLNLRLVASSPVAADPAPFELAGPRDGDPSPTGRPFRLQRAACAEEESTEECTEPTELEPD